MSQTQVTLPAILWIMGNEIKRGFKDRFAAGVDNARGFADDAGSNAKRAAGKVADQAVKAKDSVDAKIRAGLDEAYAVKRKVAIENVARLRKANANCSPKDLIQLLEEELKAADEATDEKTEAFTSAASLYMLSVVEVHGAKGEPTTNSQRLIDVVVALDSKAAKVIAAAGGFAVALLAKRFGPVGKVVKGAAKFGGKVALVAPILNLAGIKNPGKKGAAWAVVAATEKILGEPPKSWPKAEAPKVAAAKSVKASKPKTTAK